VGGMVAASVVEVGSGRRRRLSSVAVGVEGAGTEWKVRVGGVAVGIDVAVGGDGATEGLGVEVGSRTVRGDGPQ